MYWSFTAVLVLVLQNAGLALLLKYTQQEKQTANIKMQMLLAEILKILLGFVAHWKQFHELKPCNMYLPLSQIVKCGVPVCLYIVQNFLSFYAMQRLPIATFQALAQLKLIFAAVFASLMLKRNVNREQWFCLIYIACGAAVVCLDGKNCDSSATQQYDKMGIVTVICISMLSGFTGCYTEKILKTQHVCPYIQSSVIAAISSLCLICALTYEFTFDVDSILLVNVFANFTPLVWLLIFNLSVGGFLVVLVIRLVGNVIKGISIVISLLISSVLSCFIFNNQFSLLLNIGIIIICFATYQYTKC